MDLKEEFKELLQRSYTVITNLNKSADMGQKQMLLQENGQHSQVQAKKLIKNLHQLVNALDEHLQTFLNSTVTEKVQMLQNHSGEIIQYADYLSNLCIIAENFLKEKDSKVTSRFGLELKAEFLKSLKECRELKLVDYDTFTSMDLEVDFSELSRICFINIVSKNKYQRKHVLHCLGFGSIKDTFLQWNVSSRSDEKQAGGESACSASLSPFCSPHKNVERDIQICDNTIHPQLHNSCENFAATLEVPAGNMFSKKHHWLLSDTDNVVHSDVKYIEKSLTADCGSKISETTQLASRKDCPVPVYVDNVSCGHGYGTSQLEKNRGPTINITSCPVSCTNTDHMDTCGLENVQVSEVSMSRTHIAKMSEDKEMEEIEYTVKQELSFSDCHGVAGQQEGSSDTTLHRSVREEPEDLKMNACTSKENIAVTYNTDQIPVFETKIGPLVPSKTEDQPFIPSKTEDLETSHCKKYLWDSSTIQPTKMTFDLRTVLHFDKFRAPEINAVLYKTLTGGSSTSFSFPTGLTVTSDGLLVIADTGNHLVKVMNDDNLLMTIGKDDGVKFIRPSAVVADNEGNIYVKDDVCIQIFNRKGTLLRTMGRLRFQHPYGLALTEQENEPVLMVIDSGRPNHTVYNYYIREDKLLSYPFGPALKQGSKVRFIGAYHDFMLVSDLGASVMYLTFLNGKTVKTFGTYGACVGEFKEPSGITVDAVGNWIVGDSKNNRLQAFTCDGQVMATVKLSSPIRRPSGIHLTSDGDLYVINYLDHVIKVFKLL